MLYKVLFLPRAEKELGKLPRSVRVRILRAIHALVETPRPSGCVKLADSEGLWRIRAGSYRVVYQIQDDRLIVLVVRVAHRREVYR